MYSNRHIFRVKTLKKHKKNWKPPNNGDLQTIQQINKYLSDFNFMELKEIESMIKGYHDSVFVEQRERSKKAG